MNTTIYMYKTNRSALIAGIAIVACLAVSTLAIAHTVYAQELPVDNTWETSTQNSTDTSSGESFFEITQVPVSSPVLSTDKEDYLPGQTATIFGNFFQSLTNIVLKIFGTNEDGSTYTVPDEPQLHVTTDESGFFQTTYTLENIFRPLYTVIANALSGEELARTTFTDAPAAIDLEQCRNGAAGSPNACEELGGSSGWVAGNVGASQGHYLEGHSIPYRAVLTNLPTSTTITLTLGYDIKHSGAHAIDYLTSYERLDPHAQFGHGSENVDPTDGVSGFSATTTQYPVPVP